MILHVPALDWLTLTAFDANEAIRMFNACTRYGQGEPENAQILGYSGRQWGGTFCGEGIQKGQRHHMMRATGEAADILLDSLRDYNLGHCTRIDLQITLYLPLNYSARSLADKLRVAKWPGYKRSVHLIEGTPKGFDTVYIGSRASERFTRIYVRAADKALFLRYEVEYKGDFASGVYSDVCNQGREAMCSLLSGSIDELPDIDDPGISAIRERLAMFSSKAAQKIDRVRDDNATLLWLARQVNPALLRLLNDHDARPFVTKLINSWNDAVQSLDKT